MLSLSVIIKSMDAWRIPAGPGGARRGEAGQGEDRTDVRKIDGGDHYYYTHTHVPVIAFFYFVLAPRKNMTHSTLFDFRTFRDGDA